MRSKCGQARGSKYHVMGATDFLAQGPKVDSTVNPSQIMLKKIPRLRDMVTPCTSLLFRSQSWVNALASSLCRATIHDVCCAPKLALQPCPQRWLKKETIPCQDSSSSCIQSELLQMNMSHQPNTPEAGTTTRGQPLSTNHSRSQILPRHQNYRDNQKRRAIWHK
ncbi:hypothetical protein BJX62DRAFT_163686 [Aspergillus germanicus]